MNEEAININRSVIEACKKGNTLAQYTLYNQYSKAMYNLACRMMDSKEDAEDILQEAFTDAFKKLGSYRFESTFGAWLKTIVINRCINQLKKRKVEFISVRIPEKEELNNNVNENYTKEDIQKVNNAIEKLPHGYRVVFTLYLMEGYDHSEIAGILNISESTSKSQYMRAKSRLRNILSQEDLSWTT